MQAPNFVEKCTGPQTLSTASIQREKYSLAMMDRTNSVPTGPLGWAAHVTEPDQVQQVPAARSQMLQPRTPRGGRCMY